ncbi:hypothetical protein SCHPADRAFT_906728 [Schizopora paradoxa]|uniref:F-box domain-containing protein n=1 Tax=Schizopora paradoxa TaxID=27342 RepID=A0A0H2RG94_9AGAM|nr:hypothetical protein SCHPADRAFT_906728 [Schizopora paradoxa]
MSLSNIVFLPPELLETIFDHAIQSLPTQERSLQALAYSHVCRSFRLVALDSPLLWTCLHGRPGRRSLSFIETCIERSRTSPLDVVLHFYRPDDEELAALALDEMGIRVDGTFEMSLIHCARWRSCSWQFVKQKAGDGETYPCKNFLSLFHNVDAPLLERLSIGMELNIGHLFNSFKGIHQLIRTDFLWNAPNLDAITATNTDSGIPIALHAQLRYLTVEFRQLRLTRQIDALRARLKSMTVLSTIRLSLVDCCFHAERVTASYFPFTFDIPSVQIVSITLLGCTEETTYTRAHLLWGVFGWFHFSNAVQLDVIFNIEDRENIVLWNSHNIALYSILAPNTKYPQRFPSLQTLNVTILPKTKSCPPSSQTSLSTILLPHCCVPTLKHLRVQSTQYWTLLDGVGEFDESQPPYFQRGGEVVPIALETATFEIPCVDGILSWVEQLASKMRDTGCWDQFSELRVIQNGEALVIPRDDVNRWCEAC